MKKLTLGFAGIFLLAIFTGGNVFAEKVYYSKIDELPTEQRCSIKEPDCKRPYKDASTNGNEKAVVTAFQKWYNDNCEGNLDLDGLYGPKTDEARWIAEEGCGEDDPEEKKADETPVEPQKSTLPIVKHGGILAGPAISEDGKNYVTDKLGPAVVNWLLVFLLAIGVIMIIVGGIIYIVSMGKSELMTKAKETVTWTVLGVSIAILSYAIVKLIIGINFVG